MKLKYVGAIDAVDVRFPSGATFIGAARGDVIEVDDADAEAVADNENWSPVRSRTTEPKEG